MKDDVYLCFECGAKNRVMSTSNLSRAKCAKCKKHLFPEQAINKSPKKSQPPDPVIADGVSQHTPLLSKNDRMIWVGVFVLFAVGVGLFYYYEGGSTDSSLQKQAVSQSLPPGFSLSPPDGVTLTPPVVTPPAKTEPLPPAVYQAPGVIWSKADREGNSPLAIVTSAGSDYYVKLVDSLSGAEKMGIFVKGGEKLEVLVPIGSYKMRYATGKIWRGTDHLFGPGSLTSYQQSSSTLSFTNTGGYYSGYTVKLIRQVGGNMQTKAIAPSSF